MCDTMVALGNTTKDGSVLFAKNSDRQPNEPLLFVYVPSKTYCDNEKVQCTYIEIDQVKHTNKLFMVKPSWMWGCEMGTNEYGLTVGNEAVFTKEKVNKIGLLGMDLVRLALERCTNSKEAIHCITHLLETYGQGGNCGYEKAFTYHNSFLICDQTSAWVLETAGNYWVAKRVKDVKAISNRLTIGENYDLAHPKLVSHAMEKGWHNPEKPFHFAKSYGDFIYTKLSGSSERASCAMDILQENKGSITVNTIKKILRSHHSKTETIPVHQFSVKSVCMHAGFLYGDQTTGSYIVSLQEGKPIVGWITGSSTPCISIFKPATLFGETTPFYDEHDEQALHFWLEREYIHRQLMQAPLELIAPYDQERQLIETKINTFTTEIFHKAWEIENSFVKKYKHILSKQKIDTIKGNFFYRYYWRKQNNRLHSKHKAFFHKFV